MSTSHSQLRSNGDSGNSVAKCVTQTKSMIENLKKNLPIKTRGHQAQISAKIGQISRAPMTEEEKETIQLIVIGKDGITRQTDPRERDQEKEEGLVRESDRGREIGNIETNTATYMTINFFSI